MAEHNQLGTKGEEAAIAFLAEKGFKIIETNWRFGHAEIDIIAIDGPFLVIVEVKTRQSEYVIPQDAVNRKKQKLLVQAAEAYVLKNKIPNEVRFDIIAVISTGNKNKIQHIKNAFYPIL